jgi:hypothetical protein
MRRQTGTAKRQLLDHMVRCDGAWLPEDPLRVLPATLQEMETTGWARLERQDGEVVCASITALGRAALRWGVALVHSRH